MADETSDPLGQASIETSSAFLLAEGLGLLQDERR